MYIKLKVIVLANPVCAVQHVLLPAILGIPARAIIGAYHERWEVELIIDEIDTHQRAPQQRFRSQKPVGVIQEFYGLVLAVPFSEVVTQFSHLVHAPLLRVPVLRLPTPQRRPHKR